MQAKMMLFISFVVFGLIFLFDFAEVTRKFPISNMQETMFAIKLSLMRVPITFCEIYGYIYLITATFSLWNLCYSNQMTILKSVGKSPQQILFPFIFFSICLALLWLLIIHPLSNSSYEYYSQNAHSKYLDENTGENIWVDYPSDEKIFFIKKISDGNISGLYIFDIGKNSKLFAKKAKIGEKMWELNDVTIINYENSSTIEKVEKIILCNDSVKVVNMLSKPPEKHSIYQLCKIYGVSGSTIATLRTYELEFHKLLSTCVNFLLFALIAAVVCFPMNRYKTKTNVAIKIIGFSFILRFLNNICNAMANTGALSIIAATWTTTLSLMCLAIAILIWKEA
jgi:lipopolysaccharide export LptBFGC system permease protein LptF